MDEAYRVTFWVEPGHVSVKSVRRLAKRAPPEQLRERSDEASAGRYVELRDERGGVLYRRSINGLLPRTVEYPTGDPVQPFGRVPATTKRVVSILVPALGAGRAVSLVEIALRGDRRESVDLISVPLPRPGE